MKQNAMMNNQHVTSIKPFQTKYMIDMVTRLKFPDNSLSPTVPNILIISQKLNGS